MISSIVDRGGHKRGTREHGDGVCVKAAVENNLMGTEKAVVVAVGGGKGRIASDVMDDWLDKGLEGTGEGVDMGPRVGVNGFDKLVKRAVRCEKEWRKMVHASVVVMGGSHNCSMC